MDSKQVADRAQFRRYAEAALSRGDVRGFTAGQFARKAFDQATAMMLAEGQAFERYEILALEAITADERNRHAEGS